MIVRVERHPGTAFPRVRVWVKDSRLHHGQVGKWLVTAGGVCVAAGLALMGHDWPDRSAWNHPKTPARGILGRFVALTP